MKFCLKFSRGTLFNSYMRKVFNDPDQSIIFNLNISVDNFGDTKVEKYMQKYI